MAYTEDWYVSNAGGMALEPTFSLYALRSKYGLSVGSASFAELPEGLRKYYDPSYRIELRTLYEAGVISRRQWLFRDDTALARLTAVFEDDDSGFIEVYNADKLITESHAMRADGSDYSTRYYYTGSFLIRAETWLYTPFQAEPEAEVSAAEASTEDAMAEESPSDTEAASAASARAAAEGIEAVPVPRALDDPVAAVETEGKAVDELLWTDYYRYTRSYALRSVERRYFSSPEPGQEAAFFRSPPLITGIGAADEFVKPGSVFSSEFFEDVLISSGDRILYNTDARGRVQSEIRRDENDEVLGEVINTWSGNRLASVRWKSDTGERLIEYEYNSDGDRIFERDFRDGVLERTVRRDGDREVEELHMNGAVVLRAVWEEGRKISEERLRPAPLRKGRE
ncbi:hypothetical protein FACS1894137_01790 [Spirochaetia bacterium]|nr:hypothetical protein FACS1894137_01790 [Spirochaetia bacterium]